MPHGTVKGIYWSGMASKGDCQRQLAKAHGSQHRAFFAPSMHGGKPQQTMGTPKATKGCQKSLKVAKRHQKQIRANQRQRNKTKGQKYSELANGKRGEKKQ